MMVKDYIVRTYDNREYTMPEDDALDLIEAWKGSDRSFPIDFGNEAISSSNIKAIEPRYLTEADIPKVMTPRQRQLASGQICRGQRSVELEINNLARKAHPKDWPKYIMNKPWREDMRQKLITNGEQWCDYKANACACDTGFRPDSPRHSPAGVGRTL